MDFEKIVEFIPVAITIWRLEQDPRLDPNTDNFRLVYANNKASEVIGLDLYDLVGRKLYSIPPNVSDKYPSSPDAWLRVLITHEPEIIQKELRDKTYEISLIPLDIKCVAVVYRDTTNERFIEEKAAKSIANIKKTQNELVEFRRKKSVDGLRIPPPLVRNKKNK